MSLLELMTASAITATLMASSMIVLRSSHAAWRAHEADLERAETAHAVLRHLIRNVRQAEVVSAISPSTDDSGSLSLLMPDGDTYTWEHNGGYVSFNRSSSFIYTELGYPVDTLTFQGYEADGVTLTTEPADVQTVKCVLTVTMPQGDGLMRTVSCTGWIRSW